MGLSFHFSSSGNYWPFSLTTIFHSPASYISVLCQLLIYHCRPCHCSSHWPLSVEARVNSRPLCVGFGVDIGTEMGFPPSTLFYPLSFHLCSTLAINPLKPELYPICYLLALLAHHFLHVSRIRVKSLTFRWLMSYIYGAPILDVSRSHTTTQHSR